jgi:hypothetical protein
MKMRVTRLRSQSVISSLAFKPLGFNQLRCALQTSRDAFDADAQPNTRYTALPYSLYIHGEVQTQRRQRNPRRPQRTPQRRSRSCHRHAQRFPDPRVHGTFPSALRTAPRRIAKDASGLGARAARHERCCWSQHAIRRRCSLSLERGERRGARSLLARQLAELKKAVSRSRWPCNSRASAEKCALLRWRERSIVAFN